MLVTPDDFIALKEEILDSIAPLDAKDADAVFHELVRNIEARLVITEPGGATQWYRAVVRARRAIVGEMRGVSPGMLDSLATIATKYLRLGGTDPQRRLAFMRSPDLRAVAETDWSRLIGAGEREDAKTAAIAAGSVVEAIVLDVLERLPAGGVQALRDHVNALPNQRKAKGNPWEWTFAFMLRSVGPDGLKILTDRTYNVGNQLRDWRNFVHPNVSRSEAPLTAADGRLAAGFAEKVVEEVENWTSQGAPLVVPSSSPTHP